MKGKSLNKRLSSSKIRKQQHLLEVTVRADKARAMRFRAVTSFVFKTVLWLAFLGGTFFGGRELLRRFVWENPDYYLTDIRVSDCELLQRDQILAAASIREGMNVFEVDTKTGRAALDALPQVERAEIQRVLPNRVDITITERRPIAWVTQGANENPTANLNAWLIDARGVVVKPRQIIEQYHHLPHISGVTVANFAPGQRVKSVEMESALKLIQINSDNTEWQVRHIDLGKQWCMIVTDQSNARITFGLDAIDEQLGRLFRYIDRAEAEHREIETLNLMVVKFTPVTFRPTANSDEPDDPLLQAESESDRRDKEQASTPKPVVPVAKAVPVSSAPRSAKSKTENKPSTRSGSSTPAGIRKPFRQN
ncbi:MAG TPA: FtsQ-type POTRA domain-containing protein [Chthoniobacteraceae bacterium]|nr:FtsQ-type POTRA domain-containing protein [Chthoniobacteraceae bacterium]